MSIDNSADKLTIRDFDHPYVVEHYDELIASADATLNEGCHLEGDTFIKWLQAHLSGAQLAAMKRRQLGGDATSLLDDIVQVITKPRVARRYLKSRRHIAIFMSRDHAGHVVLMETLVKAVPTLNVLASSPAPNGRFT